MSNNFWYPYIHPKRCTGCGNCIDRCPTKALGFANGKAALSRPEACIYCAVCEDSCPASAIELPLLIRKADSITDEYATEGER